MFILVELKKAIRLVADIVQLQLPGKRGSGGFEFAYTQKHGSWLNMAEIELNVLMGQCLKKRIDNIKTMNKEAYAWQHHRNNKKATINWQFTNNEARIKIKHFYPTISY